MRPLALLLLAGFAAVGPRLLPQQLPPPKPPAGAPSTAGQQVPPPGAALPARDTRSAVSTGTGVIRGRVLSAETGEPLRHARVELMAAELRATRAVPSDLEGRFEFRNLPQGRFTLRAIKNGYVTLSYGQHRAFQSGRRIDLASGQVFEEGVIALPRGAVIAGRVVNDLGEAVAGIRVAAYRLRYRDGRREAGVAGQTGQTNDLGQYRISALPTGTYLVGTFGGATAAGAPSEEGVTLATTYHPDTANLSEARPVTVRPAQEAPNIDIAMVVARAASVTGTVFDSRGRPASGLAVTVRPRGDSLLALLNTATGTVQPGGRFTVRGLMPGDYLLRALVRTPDSKDQETAEVPLAIGGDDIEGMTVTSSPNGRIIGRILFDGEAKPAFAPGSLRVSVTAPEVMRDMSAQVGVGWTFEIGNVEPGRLTAAFDALPAGWAVKKIVADGRDVTESPFRLAPIGAATAVEITLTDKPTTLSGVVSRAAKSAAPDDFTVVVFGDDPAAWREGSKRVLVARPDQKGTYKLTGLPPGRYRAIAVEYLDDGEQWNPGFLGWARTRAARVELADGAAVKLNLPLTRYGS